MAFSMLHLSDLHIGGKCRRHPNSPSDAAKFLVSGLMEDLAALGQKLDLRCIVISGDCTQKGQHEEFEAAAQFVRTLSEGTAVPLNHFIIVRPVDEQAWSELWRRF